VDLAVAATAFALIFPAELPDKTFVATLVLATRYPGRWVWVGVAAAFAVQTTIAVTAGGLLSLLPERAVLVFTATLFTVGSVILLRSAGRAGEEVAEEQREYSGLTTTRTATRLRVAAISFGVLFAAEWGDLSQILTAGLAARYADPVSVFVGAWTALAGVAAIGVLAGRTLLRRIHPGLVRRVAGSLFALLALATWLAAAGLETPL
jgi:putative Ca2+/H+ antiporter (TMEM165/GDT1 family)